MLSSDEIPEQALNVVNAFVSKNEASRRLLPVISRICDEDRSGSQPEYRLRIELTRARLGFLRSSLSPVAWVEQF
jgi:hypothetical protein